jgi:hypothetical protein
MEIAEPSHILFGSDFPFSRHLTPVEDVESTIAAFETFGDWDASTRRAIESENALKLFPRFAKSLSQMGGKRPACADFGSPARQLPPGAMVSDWDCS